MWAGMALMIDKDAARINDGVYACVLFSFLTMVLNDIGLVGGLENPVTYEGIGIKIACTVWRFYLFEGPLASNNTIYHRQYTWLFWYVVLRSIQDIIAIGFLLLKRVTCVF